MQRNHACALGVCVAIVTSALAVDYPGKDPGAAHGGIAGHTIALWNSLIRCEWSIVNGSLAPDRTPGVAGDGLPRLMGDEAFVVVLRNGKTIGASRFSIDGPPRMTNLRPEPKSPNLARHSKGVQVALELVSPDEAMRIDLLLALRDGSNYVRQIVTLHVLVDLPIERLELVHLHAPGAEVVGTVPGSPVFAGNVFFAYEHPRSDSVVEDGVVRCSVTRRSVLRAGETLAQSSVIGVVPEGQRRRGFLYYVERERAHPYRPFPHYNSWYDLMWPGVSATEAQCVDVIDQFGTELTTKRGVRIESFVWDDGWDDTKTLWQYDKSRFPNGFTKMLDAARKHHSTLGFWMSPWGGYGGTREERLKFAKAEGFETGPQGFSMAGPRYFARFEQTAMELIKSSGSNFYKFDGMDVADIREADAMLRLAEDLRRVKPDIFLSLTSGTWPSPFWLWLGDSTWRGGSDMGWEGIGSKREQWITYRDFQTWRGVVHAGPLFPLNSLMTQGVAHARYGYPAENGGDPEELRHEFRSFFASGTCLQELYITPSKMTQENWDNLAEAMKWSAANADVLSDTHWIGAPAGKSLEPYGWASWCKRKGILALRNPLDKPASISLDIKTAFELPAGAARSYVLSCPWKGSGWKPVTLAAAAQHTFDLAPFEVLVLDAQPRRDETSR